jgi:hypothetical protein
MIAIRPTRRRRPCVKCGTEPRHVDLDGVELFLGPECLVSGAWLMEQAEALAADPLHPRLWLVQERGWHGGWPKI